MHVRVTPDELRAAADHLADVSGRMTAVLKGLQSQLGAQGAPWGDDKIGDGFAHGGNGYDAQRNWVDGSITAKTDLLDHYSQGLHRAADTMEQVDQV
jgi:uncharacterized protein YukE